VAGDGGALSQIHDKDPVLVLLREPRDSTTLIHRSVWDNAWKIRPPKRRNWLSFPLYPTGVFKALTN